MTTRTLVRGAVVALLTALALAAGATAGRAAPVPTTAPRSPVTGPPSAPVVTLPTMPARPPRLALVGDSVAAGIADQLATVAKSRGTQLRTFTRVGCGITNGVPVGTNSTAFSTQCVRDNDGFLAQAAAQPVDGVVLMSSWEVNSHVVDGRRLEFRSPEWDAWMTGQLDAIRHRFRDVPLLLATVAPRAPLGTVSTMSAAELDMVLRYDEFLRGYATMHPGEAAVVDVDRILCPTDPRTCPEYFGTARPRPDLGAHFDAAGAAWFAPQMADAIQRAWEQVGAVITAPPGF